MKKYYFIINRKKAILYYIIRGFLSIVFAFLFAAVCILITAFFKNPNIIVGELISLPLLVITFVIRTARCIITDKGIQLCDNYMKYNAYNAKIRICYDDITNVEMVGNESISKSKAKKYVVACGKKEHYVKLSSKKGKEYYLPIADTENFINDVLMRCNTESTDW